jgi:hypothetical protein
MPYIIGKITWYLQNEFFAHSLVYLRTLAVEWPHWVLPPLQAWFFREVRFLEVTSVGVLDDTFDSLVSSRLALDAVAGIIAAPERSPAVWQAVAKSVPKVKLYKLYLRMYSQDLYI